MSATIKMMDGVETIGQRIRRERLARSMTQRDLAGRVDVGVPHISKVEAGRENPSDELLGRVARELDLDADELFIVAGRVPNEIADSLAADPSSAIKYLRKFNAKD